MPLKIYEYKGCGTCRKALKYLEDRKVAYEKIPIREQPPTKAELKTMLTYVGDLRKLFNTSGGDYKALGMKEKLPKISTDEAIDLLSKNGNLVKRPFVIGKNSGIVGFEEEAWKDFLKKQ